jgi:hypothetical protein
LYILYTLYDSVANITIYHSICCEQKSVIKHAVRQLGPVPRGIRAARDSGLAPGARQSGTASKIIDRMLGNQGFC